MRLFAIIAAVIFLLALPVRAEDFTVNIKVDVIGEDSAQAREKAHAGAAKAAVEATAKRLTDEAGVDKISHLNQDQLINFVKETSVTEEKTPPNRYIANLSVIVNTDLLKQYMRERDIYISQTAIPQILIIPLFNETNTGSPMLWEVDNTWRTAWNNTPIDSSVNFNIIKDNESNISAISSAQAYNFDKKALEELKDLNNVDDIYVLSAAYNGVDGLDVDIAALSGYRDNIHVEGVKSAPEEMFADAIAQIAPLITANAVNRQDTAALPDTAEITVLYPFNDLSDWVTAESKIKAVPAVEALEVQAFSPGKTQFTVKYTGELDELMVAIKSLGYLLENSGNYMILKYIGD
mgnify:CR=1 FL=1